MNIEDQMKDEKLQYDINREYAKTSALSSGKIDKYEYLASEEILPFNKQKIIEQAKVTYSPLGKAFEKQTKSIEDEGRRIIDALETLKLKETKETKPVVCSDYFLNGLDEIWKNNQPIYYFEGPENAPINFVTFKAQIIFLRAYMMMI